VLSTELLVEGAVDGAERLGVSEAVIGLTVLAIGTSARRSWSRRSSPPSAGTARSRWAT
jgi:hypothetical protein